MTQIKLTSHGSSENEKPNMNPLNLKVILVGYENVGKTTLLHRFTDGEFTRNSQSTVSAAFRCKLCQYKQYRVTLGIWDTAGQRKFDNTVFYKRAKVALLCYDITNMKSFNDLNRFIDLVRKEAEPNCLFAIIGTKNDLADRNHRQVPFDRAKKYAKEVGAAFALETSAFNGYQVNDVFHRVISTYVDTYLEAGSSVSSLETKENGYHKEVSVPDSGEMSQTMLTSAESFNNLKTPLTDRQDRTTICTCRCPCVIL